MSNTPLTTEEIHTGTLKILKKIIEICDEININYFLAYGSLIGAVRHKGFIPWDDDCDIIMLRPEFEKFCAYCEKNEDKLGYFKLMSKYNTPDYSFNIPRFCDLRYRMESKGYPDAGMGLFIDIYPFDGAGNEKKDKTKCFEAKMKNAYMLLNGLSLQASYEPSKKGKMRSLFKYPVYYYARKKGSRYFLDKFDKIKDKYSFDNSRYIGCITWDNNWVTIEKECFENYTYLDFEGIKVKVPQEYDKVLRNSYGNYMELPPEDKRIATHDYKLYRKGD